MGSVKITFDPTQIYINYASDITPLSLNIAVGSPLAFSYVLSYLEIGGSEDGTYPLDGSGTKNDFFVGINDILTSPTFYALAYTQKSLGEPNGFYSLTGSVTFTLVPEPSTWGLMTAAPAARSWIVLDQAAVGEPCAPDGLYAHERGLGKGRGAEKASTSISFFAGLDMVNPSMAGTSRELRRAHFRQPRYAADAKSCAVRSKFT